MMYYYSKRFSIIWEPRKSAQLAFNSFFIKVFHSLSSNLGVFTLFFEKTSGFEENFHD